MTLTNNYNVKEVASLTDTGNGSLTLNAPAKTYIYVYIKNTSEYTETIKFDYTYSGDIFRIETDTMDVFTGSFSKVLAAGEKISIMLRSNTQVSSATLNNFSCTVDKPVAGYSVNFVSSDGCKLNVSSESKIDGTEVSTLITGNNTSTVAVGSGNVLTRPVNLVVNTSAPAGKKLNGWYTVSGGVKSELMWKGNPSTFDVEESNTYYAEFIDEDVPLYFIKGTTKIFSDLNAANAAAKEGDVIIMAGNGPISGSNEIKAGVTLLIPSDESYSCYNSNAGPAYTKDYTLPSAYTTMTMQSGASLTVKGSLCVNGTMAAGVGGNGNAGAVTGTYGCINMSEGSTITLADGSALYSWGYITGNGTINAQSGAKVYENFQFTDFRGGTATSDIADESDMEYDEEDNPIGYKKRVFPISQYYIQNIEVPVTFNCGAEEHVISNVYADSKYNTTKDITFIAAGTQTAMFKLEENSTLTKQYNNQNDRLVFELNGSGTISEIFMVVNGIQVTSSEYTLPLTNNITFNTHGGTLTTEYDLALLPGVEMNIGSDATFVVGEGTRFYVYDKDDYKAEYIYPVPTNLSVKHSPTKSATRAFSALQDAKICVEGVMTVDGNAYTTAGGANVYTSGNGKINITNKGTETCTYQVTQKPDVAFVEVPITNLCIKGDVDNNDKVDIVDLTAIVNKLNSKTPASYNSNAADVDNDGSVTANDIIALKNIILHK